MLSAVTDKAKIIILGASVISINIQRKISKYINILEETLNIWLEVPFKHWHGIADRINWH